MPSTMTTLSERRLLDAVFSGQTLPTVATVYFGLFLTLPDDSGATGNEVTGNGYARVPIANTTVSFANATTATGTFVTSKWNTIAITFPADVTADWGQVIGLGVFDALTSGNMLWVADITPFRTIQVGDTAQVPSTSLTMTLD
jgi:hypothetical protein